MFRHCLVPSTRSVLLTSALFRLLEPAAAAFRAVGDACFLEIQFVFDAPARVVGDLAVAQEFVDELALGIDQLFLESRGNPHVLEPILKVLRKDLRAADIARAQQFDHFLWQLAPLDKLFKSLLYRGHRGLSLCALA